MERQRLVFSSIAIIAFASCGGSQNLTSVEASSDALTAQTVAGRYIIVLKKGVARNGVRGQRVADVAASIQKIHGGKILRHWEHALHGMAARLSPSELESMRKDSRVAYIEPDGIVKANTVQADPPWGLDRIDQQALPLDKAYSYPTQAGEGVHAYVIDTGVYAAHSEFALDGGGSRVVPGYDFIDMDENPDDCMGHGTHVAGTIGGKTYGVAKKVTIHSVRVLGCDGSGTDAGVIDGINWVTQNHIGPAVANISIGGDFSQALNDAVTNSIAAGITYAIAAGNDLMDACWTSPASTPNAITVAASNSTDQRAGWSNYGSCVDIFAPGVGIKSAWIGASNSTNTISGTSMATPHVVGTVSLWLGLHPTATPADVALALTTRAVRDLVQDPGLGSPNLLLYAGNLAPPDALPPQLAFLDVAPSRLEAGKAATGTVVLSNVSPAGGINVEISTDSPTLVTVPPTVLVPEGHYSATFTIASQVVTATTPVAFTAKYPSNVAASAGLTLLAPPLPTAVTFDHPSAGGGQSVTGTVTLDGPAPAGGALVSLASTDTSVGTAPATVLIPAGSTSGTFTVQTFVVPINTFFGITATYHDAAVAGYLAVFMSASLDSIWNYPARIEGGRGYSVTFYVGLTAPAPIGGATVTLTSSQPSLANVPATVLVPEFDSSASFQITPPQPSRPTLVTITAEYQGIKKTTTLVVLPNPTVSAFTLTPAVIREGQTATATVTLSGPAPSGGARVALTSDDPSTADVPATILVPAGATSRTFTIPTSAGSGTTSVEFSASYHGAIQWATLQIVDVSTSIVTSLSLTPTVIEGGNGKPLTGSMTIDPAPKDDVVVFLGAYPSGWIDLPSSVTVPAGTTSMSFTATVGPVPMSVPFTVSAEIPNTPVRTTIVTVVPSPVPASVILAPDRLPGGSSSTGTVFLSGPAPAKGAVVTLASSMADVATVPASITIPPGQTSGTFEITALEAPARMTTTGTSPTTWILAPTARATTITASYHGMDASASLSVFDVGSAVRDPVLMVAACKAASSVCDTGGLIDGRGQNEINGPNTLYASCADGVLWDDNWKPSLDRLRISTSGTVFEAGQPIKIEAAVWVESPKDNNGVPTIVDRLALYYASDINQPVWVPIATLQPTVAHGRDLLTTSFVLPDGGGTLAAIRGVWSETEAGVNTCAGNSYVDRDDVVFAVSGAATLASYDSTLKVPRCTVGGIACDTGTLVDGGGSAELHTPNTVNGACADGTYPLPPYGASPGDKLYHDLQWWAGIPSIDRLRISTVDGSPLAAGKTVRIDAKVWSTSTCDDNGEYCQPVWSLNLYFAPDATPIQGGVPTQPAWTKIADSLVPATTQWAPSSGPEVLSATFVLPTGATLPVIRASYGSVPYPYSPNQCGGVGWADFDDLVFSY